MRVLQGREQEAADIFSDARKRDPVGFAGTVKSVLNGFVRYDQSHLYLRLARQEELFEIWRNPSHAREYKPVEAVDCPLRLLWDPRRSRYEIVSGPLAPGAK
jgi:hypothetical protein